MSQSTYRSAYEEALARGADQVDDDTDFLPFMPSYMVAADTHNIANRNATFSEAAASTIDSVPKFVAASLISGANQIYNIPANLGNMFGAGIPVSDADDFMASIDSNLSEYYQDNKEGVDLVGFLASSWIPGMAGIKAVHAGQAALSGALTANKFGANTSKALGLLVPRERLTGNLNRALLEVANGESVPSLVNRNVLAATGNGLTQAVYEAAAFEVFVAASMSSSPILEGQDLGDLMTNIAWGAGLFGTIGGGVTAVKSYYATKNIAKQADRMTSPWRHVIETPSKAAPYETIAVALDQLDTMPAIPKSGIVVGKEDTLINPNTLEGFARTKVTKLESNIRTQLGILAGKDELAADAVYIASKNEPSVSRMQAFIGLKGVARLADKSAAEKSALKDVKLATTTEPGSLEAAARGLDINTSYSRVWGAGAGKLYEESPAITSVVDLLKKGQEIKVTAKGVSAGSHNWSFNSKEAWSILETSATEANARYLWAGKLGKFPEPTVKKPVIIDELDIPMMEKALEEFSPAFKIRLEDKTLISFSDVDSMFEHLVRTKRSVGATLADSRITATAEGTKKLQLTQPEIEAVVNVRPGFLSGTSKESIRSDVLALQSYAEDYTENLIRKGERIVEDGLVDMAKVPQTLKLTYDAQDLTRLAEGHVMENMTRIKEQQKLYMIGTTNAANGVLGAEAANFGAITTQMIKDFANRIAPGAGGATAASANYGSLAAFTEYLGKTTIRTIEKAQDRTREALEPALFKLGQNSEAAIEYATLSNTLRSIPDNYILNKAGDAMVSRELQKWEAVSIAARAAGDDIPEVPVMTALDAPTNIPIKNKEVADLIRIEQELNGSNVRGYAELRTAQGLEYKRDPDAYYPIPVNPKDYKHFALVSDASITGTGHTKTLYAATAEELAAMAKKLDNNPQLTVRFKGDAEEFYKSRGQFEYEKTLSDNYLDAAMYRKGVSSSFLVPTDPKKIIDETLNWHLQRSSGLVREAVAVKYEVPFAELRRLGDSFTKADTSQFSSMTTLKYAADVVKNPYADFIKTSLGIRKYSDYPFLVEPNKYVEHAFSSMYNRLAGAVTAAKNGEELAQANSILKEAGYKGAAYDIDMDLFANHQARKGVLTGIVQKANTILATVVLRWDPLNAVNNAVSANVLLGAETAAVMRAVAAGDSEAVGALTKLTRIGVPGTKSTILNAGKMIAASALKFGRDTPEMAFYKKHGYITSISDQYKKTLDDLTFDPKESVEAWSNRIDGVHKTLREAGNTGEVLTGNRLAEEFNRFVAADVMKQMTDVAVTRNLMTSQEQLAYINTFVNRTQGNYLAAQRPMMFQGPVGQAIGLFQTYQFNLIQQLLRHVGEGATKDSMSLLALQGSIHGMNGLPAFNAINTNIIGNASGNVQHKDAYDAVYGAAGKQAGDWLMYGVASNMLLHPDLKINLYVRGDINPRHLTIVPTDPSQVAIVQATGKFLGNLFETAGKITGGGDVGTSILQGLEHNGVSRPLAGLAQTLQALENPMAVSYSTSKRGNVIASNDLLSLANLGRIVGGKPLDEAIAIDASFRFKSYGLVDSRKRRRLGETVKTTLIAGNEPSEDQIAGFAESYVAAGGKQEQFNSWFLQQYKTANLSQANKIAQDLNNPFSQSMQRLMGGAELRDFTE